MKLYSLKTAVCKIESNIDNFYEMHESFKKHRRLKVFYEKGYSCVKCGITANSVVKWKSKTGNSTHWDLFYLGKSKKNVLMTVDHIIPKSKGGKNNIENLQPMCYICNEKKGNIIEND